MAFGATSPLRPHATTRINNYILNRKCVHIDAWLHWQERTNSFVIEVLVMLAARERVAHKYYAVGRDGLVALGEATLGDDWRRVTINGQWARSHPATAKHLNEVHWAHVFPTIDKLRQGYPRSSVILHYIRAPSVDPCEGIDNMYDVSGRGERDRELAEREAQRREQHLDDVVIVHDVDAWRAVQRLLD